MESNWIDFLLRILNITGTTSRAVQDYQQMRDGGTWSGAAFVLGLLLLLLYVGGATVLLFYGLVLAPADSALFLPALAIYVGGGLPLYWKLAAVIDRRFASKGGASKPKVPAS
jgi:hypothetical protein